MTTRKLIVDGTDPRTLGFGGYSRFGSELRVVAEVRAGEEDDELVVEEEYDWIIMRDTRRTIRVDSGQPTLTVAPAGNSSGAPILHISSLVARLRMPADFDGDSFSTQFITSWVAQRGWSRNQDEKGNTPT